ncbi:hypothetical protein M9H77_17579 [Catharanthus roseus]|uniref:Uncharacterized protein n=1 Tax=Catharanthus roseus TaxID=4058 RepID=A0ACC0B4Z4_CATRO|nr:hypothetical protein M9H77_17579 [Catharanthus roseus]
MSEEVQVLKFHNFTFILLNGCPVICLNQNMNAKSLRAAQEQSTKILKIKRQFPIETLASVVPKIIGNRMDKLNAGLLTMQITLAIQKFEGFLNRAKLTDSRDCKGSNIVMISAICVEFLKQYNYTYWVLGSLPFLAAPILYSKAGISEPEDGVL